MDSSLISTMVTGVCTVIAVIIASKYTKNNDIVLMKEQITHFSEISDTVRLEGKIDNLVKDVKKHNNLMERMYKAENCIQANTVKIDSVRR